MKLNLGCGTQTPEASNAPPIRDAPKPETQTTSSATMATL